MAFLTVLSSHTMQTPKNSSDAQAVLNPKGETVATTDGLSWTRTTILQPIVQENKENSEKRQGV